MRLKIQVDNSLNCHMISLRNSSLNRFESKRYLTIYKNSYSVFTDMKNSRMPQFEREHSCHVISRSNEAN